MDAKSWLGMTTDAANDTSQWFERDLDDFLKEIHRENEDNDAQKLEEEEEKLQQHIQIPNPRIWSNSNFRNMLNEFDSSSGEVLWDFNVFKLQDLLGDATFPFFGFRIFMRYGLIDKF